MSERRRSSVAIGRRISKAEVDIIPEADDFRYTAIYEGETVYMDSYDWRKSTLVKYQIFTGYLCFTLFGLVDQSIGPLLDPIRKWYDIADSTTSLIFLSCTCGYVIVALSNEKLHQWLGMCGVMSLGLSFMFISFLGISFAPPFWALLLLYILSGISFGCLDTTVNSWTGKLVNSNELMGLLHGVFGFGCMVSPPLVTTLVEYGMQWSHYYWIVCVCATICLINVRVAFKHETRAKYRYLVSLGAEEGTIIEPVSIIETLKSGRVIAISFALFTYIGGEASLGTWMIPFLVRVKHGAPVAMSYIASSYWVGMSVGRIGLGFVTGSFPSEIVANQFYGYATFIFIVIFWFFSNPIILGIVIFFAGFFAGPMFPATVVAAIKLLPVRLHVSGLGFACSFGGSAAAAIPYIIGIVAGTDLGLSIYPLICAACFFVVGTVWVIVGRVYTLQGPTSV